MKIIQRIFLTVSLLSQLQILGAQTITTIAGSHIGGFSGNNGPALNAQFSAVLGVAADNAGNVYFADEYNNVVWKVNNSGIIGLYAGTGAYGNTGDGGLAVMATLIHPSWVSMDNGGNLYIVDYDGVIVRKVNAAGIITTFAGNGGPGGTGDGGPATSAGFTSITGAVPDNAGNVYISDWAANTIRKVNSAGIISTIAGTGTAGFSGDGGPAISAQINQPYGVAFGPSGNMYFPDEKNHRVRMITPAGVISTIAGNGIIGSTGDGGPAVAAEFDWPWTVAVDNSENIYVGDPLSFVVRRIDNSGTITRYAGNGTQGYSGDGGPASAAQLSDFGSIATDNAGNLYIADEGNFVVRKVTNCVLAHISQQPSDNTICAGGSTTFAVAVTGVTSYQWQVNSGSGWSNLSDNIQYGGTASTSLTAGTVTGSMDGYLYRCALINSCGTLMSEPATLHVNNATAASVNVTASPATLCAGYPVTFTATPIAGGTAPVYQWQINGVNTGTNDAVFIDNTPVNGDIVSCLMTSNASCLTIPSAISNNFPISLIPVTTPTINISASATSVCAGTNILFSAAATAAGSSPTYQWMVNGTTAGTGANNFSTNTLSNGDDVSCTMTSDASCITDPEATSNSIPLTVNPLLTPSISITVPSNIACSGTPTTFSANAANGGLTPTYQWQVNGIPTGANGAQLNTSTLVDGDVVSCVMTSDATCLAAPTAISNELSMRVDPLVTPTVTISASNQSICAGSSVTFSASPTNAGASPSYQWLLNGSGIGATGPVFTTTSLAGGDLVACVITGDATCMTNPSATSNTIIEQVAPTVDASLTIAASATTICAGAGVSFEADPINGGDTPSYQWMVNGQNSDGHSAVYSSASLANGDVISCIMTSSENCSASVSSDNQVSMMVNPIPTLILSRDTLIALGAAVQLSVSADEPLTIYEWTPITGLNNPSAANPIAQPLASTTYQVTVTSDAGCEAKGKVNVDVYKGLLMPSAFSPNGDGINDVFRIPQLYTVKLKVFAIYNRWGTRIFATSDANIGWDGYVNGQPQPAGAYVWQIVYEDELTGKFINASGTTMLMR